MSDLDKLNKEIAQEYTDLGLKVPGPGQEFLHVKGTIDGGHLVTQRRDTLVLTGPSLTTNGPFELPIGPVEIIIKPVPDGSRSA